jgi:hypothetical protein
LSLPPLPAGNRSNERLPGQHWQRHLTTGEEMKDKNTIGVKLFMHWIAHLLKWNYGKVFCWREGRRDMIGFRCDGCGKMQDIQTLPEIIE